MSQLHLIHPAQVEPQIAAPPLRDYQEACVEAVREELRKPNVRGTMVLLATGLGKTQVACELIRTWRGRACFIAHRAELIEQAARRIEQFTGGWPEIEKASSHASPTAKSTVVASIQSLCRPRRMERFARDAFDLIIVDEVHHGTASSYRAVLDYFNEAALVGLTATPDRADGEALGQILDSVAYRYEIDAAIADGWLAPIVTRSVAVDAIDFSSVGTVAGDFNQGQLDEVMAREESLHGVARPAVDLAGDRPTIIFTTSVANAHRLAEIIDRYTRDGNAVAVDGSMPTDERREVLRRYESGEAQFLVNVGIATEGYDHPPTACVVMGRPTKSRALYVQMLGRGTRGGPNFPIPGKTDCLVLDFKGNAGKHQVVGAADALAGDISDQGLEAIKEELDRAEEPMSIQEALEKARERWLEKKRAEQLAAVERGRVVADVAYRTYEPNPYVALGVKRDYLHERYGYAPATSKQLGMLRAVMGRDAKNIPEHLGKQEASRLIGEIVSRRKKGLCTYAQMQTLAKQGVDARRMSFRAASEVIDAIAKNGWRPLPHAELERLGAV